MRKFILILFVACAASYAHADETIDKLISRLGSGDTEASSELVKKGQPAVAALVTFTNDKTNPYQRRVDACVALGNIGGPDAINALRLLLGQTGMHFPALLGLESAGSGATNAADDIAKILRSEPQLEFFAIEALGKIGAGTPAVLDALTDCLGRGRGQDNIAEEHSDFAANALTKLGEPGGERLINLAAQFDDENDNHPAGKDYGRAYLVISSSHLPANLMPAFLKHLGDPGSKGRVSALGLGGIGLPAKQAIIKALDDKRKDAQFNAAEALARINLHARWADDHNGKDFENEPVLPNEVFPKLLAVGALPDGRVEYRIMIAMVGINHDKAMAEPMVQKTMRDLVDQGIKRAINSQPAR